MDIATFIRDNAPPTASLMSASIESRSCCNSKDIRTPNLDERGSIRGFDSHYL